MKRLFVDTSRGQLKFAVEEPTNRPLVLFIHGFSRCPAHLAGWRALLPDADVWFAYLPGHQAPDLNTLSLPAWSQAYREAAQVLFRGRDVTVVGESLGALVALSLPASRVIAVEPLLQTRWPTLISLRMMGDALEPRYRHAFFTHPHHDVLSAIQAPTTVLAGSSLMGVNPRSMPRPPSVLTDEDLDLFRANPLVTVQRIPGGHGLLDDNPDDVRRLCLQALGEQSVGSVPS